MIRVKKYIKAIIMSALLCSIKICVAQAVNWSALKPGQTNIINVQAGIEYGLETGIGYGHQLKSARPVVLFAGYSMPAGKNFFDDFKTRTGATLQFYQTGNFHFGAKMYGLFRRYENEFVRLLNFGSELAVNAGYYKSKWFVAAEAGFDKAIITHFKHSDIYKQIYPEVKDGWYEPTTGGNFYYGLQAGFSFCKTDFYINAGKLKSENGRPDPIVPFLLIVGINFKLSTK
jgi:hypothetical protein